MAQLQMTRPRRIASCLLAVTMLFGTTALADSASGAVALVDYRDVYGGQLAIQIAGISYYGQQQITPGCGIQPTSQEVLKIWQTLATTALLSGRPMTVTYAACGTFNYISGLALAKQ